MNEPAITIHEILNSLPIEWSGNSTAGSLEQELEKIIDAMIIEDFEKLLYLLYRIDVDEEKIKSALRAPIEQHGTIIARLIIQRQQEKIIARNKAESNPEIPEDERWL